MKLLQHAKFAAGAGGHLEPTKFADKHGSPHSSLPVITPAVIQIEGLHFHSETPTSAAHAARINHAIEQYICIKS